MEVFDLGFVCWREGLVWKFDLGAMCGVGVEVFDGI